MRRFPHGLLILCAVSLCGQVHAQDDSRSVTADTTDIVRSIYDGDAAMVSVAFLDRYVRWPGNRGFDASITHIADMLDAAGYAREDAAPEDARLTYRIEEYPMQRPAWEPLQASVSIVGHDQPILSFSANRNMLARRSFATSGDGVIADVVDVGSGKDLLGMEISGRIVLLDGEIDSNFEELVVNRGAIGVLAYSMPTYLKPQLNQDSIQFRGIPEDLEAHNSWAISLSWRARELLRAALADGPLQVRVVSDVLWTHDAVERTVVADIRGSESPDERFVFSAHVQEPGANDNASGVGAQIEMARVAAQLLNTGETDPRRSITFLWGLEIRSTARYVRQDENRAQGIRWGLSLDMVGENTALTGGTFLIEKMPDPSAIWTRGEDRHTEWGAEPMTKEDMTPHYFNDLVLGRALEQAASNGWAVKTNPFEGGSDHVPFLRASIPGLLLWHFTDQFYHTDRDRLEMVSPDELVNVGVTALTTAITLTTADGAVARGLVGEVRDAAVVRLAAEASLSKRAVENGASVQAERDIVMTWADWYDKALLATRDIEVGGSSSQTENVIERAREDVYLALAESLGSIGNHQDRILQ
jgi:aminopeptidase YwaD